MTTNEEKAKELSYWHCNEKSCRGLECKNCPKAKIDDAVIQMAEWKDEQFETAINKIKVNIIEVRDNKEYYDTNRETKLNWVLRLIDECCESISIQKENEL